MARRKKKEQGVFGPRKLADGREAYDVRWRNEKGENRSRTLYDLGEANKLASDQRYGRDNPLLADDITLGELFKDKEVQKTIRRRRKLSKETRKQWVRNWNTHVNHDDYGLAIKPVVEVAKTPTIDNFLNAMTEAEVGEAMQQRVLGIVSALLDIAVDRELCPRNPIRTMDSKAKPKAPKREVYIPSIEVIELLRMEVLHGQSRHYRGNKQLDALIVSLMAYEAPRPEEVLILSRHDAEADEGWLNIYSPKAKRGKSKTLERKAPLNEVVAEEITDFHDTQETTHIHSLIIATDKKPTWSETDWRNWRKRVFKPALERVAMKLDLSARKRAQLMSMRPYDLRHMACSRWLACGGKDENGEFNGSPANPVDVASWAGHEIRTLWENYAHKVDDVPHVPIAEQIRETRETVEQLPEYQYDEDFAVA